jgi:hypothetical protein
MVLEPIRLFFSRIPADPQSDRVAEDEKSPEKASGQVTAMLPVPPDSIGEPRNVVPAPEPHF